MVKFLTKEAGAALLIAGLFTAGFGLPLGAILQSFAQKTPIDISGWFQAFWSVIGIAVAIYVPWHIHERERSETALRDKTQAKSIALQVHPALVEMLGPLQRAAAGHRGTGVHAPPALTAHLDRMHLLGSAGRDIIIILQVFRMIETAATTYNAEFVLRTRYQIALDAANRALNSLHDLVQVDE